MNFSAPKKEKKVNMGKLSFNKEDIVVQFQRYISNLRGQYK